MALTIKQLTEVLAPGVSVYLGGASEYKARTGVLPPYDSNLPIKLWAKKYTTPVQGVDDERGETFTIPVRQPVPGLNGVTIYGEAVLDTEFYPYYIAQTVNIPPDKGVYAQLDPQAAQQAQTKLPISIDTTQYQVYSSPFGVWVDLIGAE